MMPVILISIVLFTCNAQSQRDTIIEEENTLVEETITKIAFGSCNFPGKDTRIFQTIAKRNADIFIWTGDATYLDYKNYDPENDIDNLHSNFFGIEPAPPDEWSHTYNITKTDKNYQALLETGIDIIGTWDDHDYGINDGTGLNNQHKDYVQQLFLDFLGVPANATKRDQKGVYEHYEMVINVTSPQNQVITKIIDIILLDIRYWSQVDGDENILGNAQWDWLEDVFDNKLHGELAIIVSSLGVIPISRSWEGWHHYQESRNKFFDMLIRRNTCKRLLLISGDLHYAELLQMQCINDNTNYKQNIYEVTSSGLTHGMGDIESFMIRGNNGLKNYLAYDGVYKCRYTGRNFGQLDLMWKWNNEINNLEIVNASAYIFDINGDEQCKLDLPLWSENDNIDIDYDPNGVNVYSYNDYTCYGGVKQHDMIMVDDYSMKEMIFFIYTYGVPAIFVIYVIAMCCVCICQRFNWCERCTRWMDKKKRD